MYTNRPALIGAILYNFVGVINSIKSDIIHLSLHIHTCDPLIKTIVVFCMASRTYNHGPLCRLPSLRSPTPTQHIHTRSGDDTITTQKYGGDYVKERTAKD